MGQRSRHSPAISASPLFLSIFATPLGQWGLLGRDEVLWGLTLGHSNAVSVRATFADPFDGCPLHVTSTDWFPALRQRLERYSGGESVKFDDIQLRLPSLTEFQKNVIQVTRKMPYGSTITYGALAERAGHPKAARAVGTVMSSNRFPIIIPCHRVVGSGNGLGGYSAPQGVNLKQKLLEMEAEV